MTQKLGDYDSRDVEDASILRNPPAAVGNPNGASVADDLGDLFKDEDSDHFRTYKAVAPNGAVLALQFDINLDGEEYTRYQKVADGNRAARRRGNTQDTKPWLSAAAMLAEKSTKITNLTSGRTYTDSQGRNVTMTSEEWLAQAGFPNDPVNAALKVFGFPQIVSLGNAYIVDTGLDAEAERVDPTSG